jgi:hypothetical protein
VARFNNKVNARVSGYVFVEMLRITTYQDNKQIKLKLRINSIYHARGKLETTMINYTLEDCGS